MLDWHQSLKTVEFAIRYDNLANPKQKLVKLSEYIQELLNDHRIELSKHGALFTTGLKILKENHERTIKILNSRNS